MADYRVKLKIADTVILMQSRFPVRQLGARQIKELNPQAPERFENFFYKGSRRPDIRIDVEIVDALPALPDTEPLFVTYHFQDKKENWRLLRQNGSYIYASPLEGKQQFIRVNKTFDRATAYLLPDKIQGMIWGATDLIYDFLQVLMINYLAQRKQGIFTHAIGIKDTDGSGLIFSGKSGAGKSTTARLWHRHTRAMVLNDDRIVVRKTNGRFRIYGSPWHGEFSDYLASRIESAVLKRIFFIYHSRENTVTPVRDGEAFNLLYSALFPAFWDRIFLENTAVLCETLVRSVSCRRLGFVNDKKVINFVRKANKDAGCLN